MKPSSVKKIPSGLSNIPKPLSSTSNINKISTNTKSTNMTNTNTIMNTTNTNKQITKNSSLNKPSLMSKPVANTVNPVKDSSMSKQVANTVSNKKIQSSSSKKVQVPSSSIKKSQSRNKQISGPGSKLSVPAYNNKYNNKYSNKKQSVTNENGISWSYLPFDLFLQICQYASITLYDVYKLSLVSKCWRYHLESQDGFICWNFIHIKDNNIKNNNVNSNNTNKQSIPSTSLTINTFKQLKHKLQQNLVKQRQKMSIQYQKSYIKLFNYGSTKQNIANKLIQRLNLQISIQLNTKIKIQKIPFKLKTYNFSSYLCFKLEEIKNFKYDFYTPHNMFKDKLEIKIKFFSRRFKVSHEIKSVFMPEDVIQEAIRQKAFNYYIDKNLILTFFEGDDHFLYFFFQMSALQLVTIFRKSINQSQKQLISKTLKSLPLHKKLAENTKYQSFEQYLKYQADFQLHMSYHNSIKQIFTFCDTKVYPKQYDNKKALFYIKVDDTFNKVDTYKLDNKMGISQPVENLFLLDFTLKDRDRFLITYSGFIYARKAELKQRQTVENYFQFNDNQMKIVQYQCQKYGFKILIIEEIKKNLIKNIQLTYFAHKIQ